MNRRNNNNNNSNRSQGQRQRQNRRNAVPQRQSNMLMVPSQAVPVRPRRQNQRRQTQAGRTLRELGGAVGGLAGVPALGRSLGAGISRIFGAGDYAVNSPVQNSIMASAPAFQPMTQGVTVSHREYIKDVQSSTGFKLEAFSINPGLSTTFPWLSKIAASFEEYRLDGMVVYLNSSSGASVASTNTGLGVWGVVTVYDPSESVFQDKQQAENYIGCQSAVPSQSLCHGIECKPRSNVLEKMYVRSGQIASTEDLKFYDWGKFQVFTSGAQAVSTIGELWVSYKITFFKPRLPSGGYTVPTDRYSGTINPLAINTYGMFSPNATTPDVNSNIGTLVSGPSSLARPSGYTGGYLNFPAAVAIGYYAIIITCELVADIAFTNYGWTTNGSLTFANFFKQDDGTYKDTWLQFLRQGQFTQIAIVKKNTQNEGNFFTKVDSNGNYVKNWTCVVTALSPSLFSAISNVPTSLLITDDDKRRLCELLGMYKLFQTRKEKDLNKHLELDEEVFSFANLLAGSEKIDMSKLKDKEETASIKQQFMRKVIPEEDEGHFSDDDQDDNLFQDSKPPVAQTGTGGAGDDRKQSIESAIVISKDNI